MPIVELIYNPKAEFADSLGGCIITTRKTKFNDLELKNGICVIMPLSFYIAVNILVTKGLIKQYTEKTNSFLCVFD